MCIGILISKDLSEKISNGVVQDCSVAMTDDRLNQKGDQGLDN